MATTKKKATAKKKPPVKKPPVRKPEETQDDTKSKAIHAIAPERVPSAQAVRDSYIVYVMKDTAKGRAATPAEHAADMQRINAYIERNGGKCSLYGDDNDRVFVSLVRGLKREIWTDLATVIAAGGNVTVYGPMTIMKD
jgi:hypothetical protein